MTEIKKENKSMSNVPNKSLHVPKLRFKQFTDQWEVKKLGEVAELITKGTTPKKFVSQGIKFIKIECFDGDTIDLQKCLFIEEQTHNKELKRSILKENDLLFAIAGATIGKINIITDEILPANTNQALAVIRLKEKENSKFIYQILKSEIMQRYIKDSISVGAQPNLNLEQMNNFSFFYPSFSEQQKLSSFLSLVDERIQTQNKIIEELKILKATLAHDIYSQQLRFHDKNNKDFCDWKVIKLGTVMSIPEKIKPKEIEKEKLLTVKLHMKGVLKNVNTESLSIGSTSYYLRKKGQFIYGKQNLFNGAFAIIPDKFDGFLSSSDVPSLEIDKTKLNNVFLFNFFGREKFYRKLEDIASGSGSKRIHEETLLKVKIQLPCLEEQTKIANFISFLDEKIKVENLLLKQLQSQKKYLLSNLFI